MLPKADSTVMLVEVSVMKGFKYTQRIRAVAMVMFLTRMGIFVGVSPSLSAETRNGQS